MTEKKPRFGTLPVLNMPKRTHDTPKPKQRTPHSVVKDHLPVPRQAVYKNFKELCQRTSGLKSLNDWNMKLMNDRFVVKKMLDPFLIPEFEIIINDSLGFTIKVFGCFLPEKDRGLLEDAEHFEKLMEAEWNYHISHHSMTTLDYRRHNQPDLSVTSDSQKLKEYITFKIISQTSQLQSASRPAIHTWQELSVRVSN